MLRNEIYGHCVAVRPPGTPPPSSPAAKGGNKAQASEGADAAVETRGLGEERRGPPSDGQEAKLATSAADAALVDADSTSLVVTAKCDSFDASVLRFLRSQQLQGQNGGEGAAMAAVANETVTVAGGLCLVPIEPVCLRARACACVLVFLMRDCGWCFLAHKKALGSVYVRAVLWIAKMCWMSCAV